MKQLVILIAVAIALYVGYTQGLPWIQQQMGQEAGAGDTAPARCVHQADRASNTFGDDIGRRFTPGGDADAWAGFVDSVREEIDAARTLCSCPGAACDKAKDAMDRLDGLIGEYDDRFRSGSGMSSNPAGEMTRIHGLLNEARVLARQGG